MSLIVTLLPKQGIKPQNPLRTHQRINILIRRMPIQPRRERGMLGEIWVLLGEGFGVVVGGFDEGVVGEVEEFEAVVACLAGAEDVAFSSGLEVYFGDEGAVEGVGDGGESFLGLVSVVGSMVVVRKQYPWWLPRPTLPRSWCSCAAPKRSALMMVMMVALGMFTPTSMTVVDMRTWVVPLAKSAMMRFFSSGSILLCRTLKVRCGAWLVSSWAMS